MVNTALFSRKELLSVNGMFSDRTIACQTYTVDSELSCHKQTNTAIPLSKRLLKQCQIQCFKTVVIVYMLFLIKLHNLRIPFLSSLHA